MKKYGLIMVIALPLLVNAFVISGVFYNRAGQPKGQIELTERELPLDSYTSYKDRENTGLSLRLELGNNSWQQHYNFASQNYNWFNQKKLEEIGFDCSMPLSSPKAKLHYEKMLARKTFVVLEYEGKAWENARLDVEAYLKETAGKEQRDEIKKEEYDDAKEKVANYLKTSSHLFAIDASNDPVSLRKKYTDVSRYIITPAKVNIYFNEPIEDCDCDGKGKKTQLATLSVNILEVLTNEIHVPPEKRPVLENLLKEDNSESVSISKFHFGSYYDKKNRDPYYKVILNYGNRYEPWVVDIKRIL